MKRWMLGGGIAVILLAGAGVGAYFYGERKAEAEAERMLAEVFAAGGVSHAPGHYSLLGDCWDLDDVVAQTPPRKLNGLRIAHLSIVGLDPLGVQALLGGASPQQRTTIATGIAVDAYPRGQVEIERLELSGVDPVTALGAAAGLPAVAAVGEVPASLTLTGIKITRLDVTASVDRVAIKGLELGSVLRSDLHLTADDIRILLAGATLEQAEILGLDLRTLGGEPVHVALRRLSIGGVAPERIGSIAAEGFTEEAAKANVSLASVSVADVIYRPRSEAARAAARARSPGIPDWLPSKVVVGRYDLGELRVSAPNVAEVALQALHATMTDTPEGSSSDARLDKLTVDLSRAPPIPGLDLKHAGLARVTANMVAQSRYDAAAKTLEVPRYAIELEGLGSLDLALSLGNLERDGDIADPQANVLRLLTATLKRVEIRYEDHALVGAILDLLAQQRKTEAGAVRAEAIAAIEQLKQLAPQDAEWAAMVDTVAAFMKDPKSIVLTVAPPQPLTFQGLVALSRASDPTALRKALGLGVR